MKKRERTNNNKIRNTGTDKNIKENKRERKNLNKSVNQSKAKRINTKNLPTFILIGLIIMLIIIAIIYYVFIRYAPEMIITYSGYAVEGKTMVENLKNSDVSNVNPYLGLIEVHENDLLYKKLNSYYIGEDNKKEIDINYPIYINEGNALLNIGPTTRLITVNYEEVEGYPDFMMTDGVMYNGADITRADGNKYIFLKSEDQIFTNVGKIKITTSSNEYEIKEFSNIYFTEDYIAYYEMQDDSDVQNWYMQYKRINDIDMDSKIEVNGETISYKTFLERLRIIQVEESINNEENENIIEENTVKEEDNTTHEENNSNKNKVETNKPDEQKWQEGQWEKPTVSCTDFEGEVYTIRTNLSVTDRAGVISRGVIFEIYLEGRLNRRALATQTGNIEITNLQPDTEFEIRGVFYYYDENEEEQEEEFYIGTVKTKPISALGTIDFSFQNGEIYSNKIELIHLKLNNDLNEEVIRGISRIQVEIGDVAFRLTNDQIDQLKAGEEITYQTSESLTSNSRIKYKITAFDRFGNELKAINNEGETITSKQLPRVSITATKQDVTEVILDVTLNNKDNVSLENYRYEITNQSGEIVKQGILGNNGTANDGSKETLTFNDLDPNGYYQIIIYGDYDLDNGEGIQQNAELGRASFVTRPLASLGYMQVHIDDKEVTQNSMNLGISIDENQTDARLLAILDKVEVVIYDQGKNIEHDEKNNGDNDGSDGNNEGSGDNEGSGNTGDSNQGQQGNDNNAQQETEVQRITFTEEQVQSLKIAEEVELNIDQLNSNTIYRIDVITMVKQGTVETVVEDKQNIEQLITLKMPAEVQVRNQFVIGTMIDLDIRIEDIDNAVLTNQVRIEVRDKDNKLIDLSEMPTNAEYKRKTYEDLTPNETYRIIVYAPQYNIGSTDATYEADYILKEIKIVTETGISGNLDLIGLEKTPTGKNLIDVSSKVNWYEKCFDTGRVYALNYNESTKTLTLGENSSHNLASYYDLSKYIGQEITISFKARSSYTKTLSIVEKTYEDFLKTDIVTYYTINDLSSEWKEYLFTVTLSKTGYIGLRTTTNDITSVEIQDLQAELGNRKTDYETFQYDYNANVSITVNDTRDEITTNDYYIRIYKNDEQIQEIRYEEIGEENKVENVQKTYNIEPDANYRIELLVKITDRYYELDSQEFSTTGARELKGILNENEYLKIQPYGEYIILNDLNFSVVSGLQYRFGSSNLRFEGKIDFNGKTVTKGMVNKYARLFDYIGNNGLIENMVLDLKLNDGYGTSMLGAIANFNYGTIRNLEFNIIESKEKSNTEMWLICYQNFGTIENFVINFKKTFYLYTTGGMMWLNYGTVKNGYICGEDIKILNRSTASNYASGLVLANNRNGLIENVFTLINLDVMYSSNQIKALIALENNSNATIQNVYSVIDEPSKNLSSGPNVYTKSSEKIYNNYYFSDEIYTSELETKGNKLSLWDATFQNQLINGDGAFIVDDLVNEGYYPQLNMPDVMPAQEYIELPEVEDADLPDILSTKVLEQGTDTVKVQFSVNNPSAELISDIKIQNLEVEILSQEYINGKSIVIAELKNPIICVSSYDVQSITTKGAFGSSYTRPYDPGERVINVDLYKEIWSVNDWRAINDSPTENYMLMTDLDFINEENTIRLDNVNGILNGNGHTISNVNLTNNYSLIVYLNGILKNIYINNFKQEATTNGGLISVAQISSSIDNVHMSNVSITKTGSGMVGGLVRDANSNAIKNSSVNNIQINTEGTQSMMRIGGIAGQINNTVINNCYVKNISVKDTKGIESGVGGIAGYGLVACTIQNCYAEGRIISENNNVGGIVGGLDATNIENCYSKVDISTTNNNVGGIIGLCTQANASTISNNLSIGNIYTIAGIDNLDRIIGFGSGENGTNYAYENQLLNGFVSDEDKGATLLNKEEILNLNLGESYNYDDKEKGILPKLYNMEGTELLPNQTDILLEDNYTTKVELGVENIEATKPNTTEAEITVRINNPEEVEITGIEIEDMTISSISRNVTQNGVTNIVVRALPTRYYDSYKLTGIRYKTGVSSEEQIKEVEAEIKVQFYKEIYTYEDWQTIEEGTFQNYRLMADIDFSGKTNVKNNIAVNRLEAENRIYMLKNINLQFSAGNAGLIQNVKNSIKNIGFENITLTNSSGDHYFGVIASNNGEIENLRFKNITITGKLMHYIGTIGGMTSGNINNVELENININGSSHNGGLVGYLSLNMGGSIKNITADKITIVGTSTYTGGILGYQYGSGVEITNIHVDNSNITGKDYTAGILGNGSQGNLTYFEVNNTDVSGTAYVGGILGYTTSSENTMLRMYMQVNSCNITGAGNYVGGIIGSFWGGYNRYWNVNNSQINVTSSSSEDVGGLAGFLGQSQLWYFQINNTTISSKGKNVGGAIGYTLSRTTLGWGYSFNTIVYGSTTVGGLVGSGNYLNIKSVYVNANVKADNSVAGGVLGYAQNANVIAYGSPINIYTALVEDGSVEAQSKAGGLIGDLETDIYRDGTFFYNNYIEADVTSTNTSTGSLLIGGRPDENPYIENTYVYRYSTLNGNYVYGTNDNIEDEQYLIRSDLDIQSTFSSKIGLGTTYWNYASLSEGKYPKIKDQYIYMPELQTGVDLPTDPEISSINSLSLGVEISEDSANEAGTNANNIAEEIGISTQSTESLPSYKVYPIKVDEINIGFSDIPEGVSFTYSVNDENVESKNITKGQRADNGLNENSDIDNNNANELLQLTQKTYTFKYNYQDTLEIKLTNGTDEETITITPDDVRSNASLVGNNNAYLLETNLYINGELQPGEYVNVYDGYALNSSGQVVDIATKQMVINADSVASENTIADDNDEESNEAVTTSLKQTTKPLHIYDYKGSTIEVYGTYSTVDGNVKLQIYNVRNGQLSAISNNVDMKVGNSIIDNYNDKEYQTVLTTSGELVDLKEQLQYPNNFLSSNIKQIVQNTEAESPEVMVLYNTGKVIVFNYVTGKVVYENDEKADSGLMNYLTRSFSSIWSDYEDKQQEYAKSKELEAKLAELSIEEAMKENNKNETATSSEDNTITSNNNNTLTNVNTDTNSTFSNNVSNTTVDNDYITVYNADTGEYEVYSEDEILNGEDENPVSETEKIKENGLEGIYGYDAKEETKPQANGAVIVISIIAVAIIALVVLRKVIVKNGKKDSKNKS